MSSIALFKNSDRNYQPQHSTIQDQRVQRRVERDQRDLRRLFTFIIGILAFLLAAEIVYHVLIAPYLVVNKISIQAAGDFPYTNEELLSIAAVEGNTYFFDVKPELISARLERVPLVKSVEVSKKFPHSLNIAITEREPLAALTILDSNKMVPTYVDSSGVIFRSRGVEFLDLPIISGIDVPVYKDGMQLPQVLTSFLEELNRLQIENPALYRLISEVKFVKKNATDYEVVLFPSQYQVRVRIGPSLTEELMKYIVLVLDVVAEKGMETTIEEIDFRTDEVVYRVGEE
ncbi:MAG: FtsQ-type POTRA domain-containing protein [Spirochaetia bacterium]